MRSASYYIIFYLILSAKYMHTRRTVLSQASLKESCLPWWKISSGNLTSASTQHWHVLTRCWDRGHDSPTVAFYLYLTFPQRTVRIPKTHLKSILLVYVGHQTMYMYYVPEVDNLNGSMHIFQHFSYLRSPQPPLHWWGPHGARSEWGSYAPWGCTAASSWHPRDLGSSATWWTTHHCNSTAMT